MSTTYRLVTFALVSFATAATAGCGDDPLPSPVTLTLAATVPPGDEIYRCRYVVLPDIELEVDRFSHRYTAGSHHILVYPTSRRSDEVTDEVFDCTTVGDLGQTGLVYGAEEQPVGEQGFPDGVGFRFEPRAVLLLEAHYLNATDTALDVSVEVTLSPAQRPLTSLAGNLFFYNYAILIPPAPATAHSAMQCAISEPITLAFAGSHMHRRGVQYRAELLSGTDRALLHETDDWESAEPRIFDPPLAIERGTAIEFRCDYKNDRADVTTEGESADRDEMCMFIASYWPAATPELEACATPGSMPLLDGSQTCLDALACFERATGPEVEQGCLASTCRGSAAALHAFVICADRAGCRTDDCIATRCGAEYLACEAAACP